MEDIKFQYYKGGVFQCVPNGEVTLEQFIDGVINPDFETLELLDKIQLLKRQGKDAERVKLKEQLPYYTPAIIVDGYRDYEHAVKFTGLCQIDFDHCSDAEALQELLFDAFPQIIISYVSPSGDGVKALMRIPQARDVDHYHEIFETVEEAMFAFQDEYPDVAQGFDPRAGRSGVQPLFYSADFFARIRRDATIWEFKPKIKAVPKTYYQARPYIPSDKNDRLKSLVVSHFEDKIRAINSGTGGHPNVRSAAIVLGGRVSAGYIPEYEARSLAEFCISLNSYLQKGLKGYIKTANWGIDQGMKSPLKFQWDR